MYEKLKSFLADDAIFMVSLLVFIGVISFGLGRGSVVENPGSVQAAGVVFTAAAPKDEIAISTSSVQVMGSRSGTKYHLLDCPSASQIKEENKVYFDSIPLAKAAGYTAAANCPGL